MRRLFIVLICFLMSSPILFAQQKKHTMSGTIKDVKTGEDVVGAIVEVKGQNIGAVTNEYGFYSLTLPEGDYTIVISYLGYGKIEKVIQLNANLKIDLELDEEAKCAIYGDDLIDSLTSLRNKRLDSPLPNTSVSKSTA